MKQIYDEVARKAITRINTEAVQANNNGLDGEKAYAILMEAFHTVGVAVSESLVERYLPEPIETPKRPVGRPAGTTKKATLESSVD